MPDLTQEGLAARGVRVKPLEWGWDADAGCYYAGPSWLEYELYEEADGRFTLVFPGATVGCYPTLEAAKAAAQADYAARILAALEDTGEPALIREAEARGMERAAGMILPYVPKMFDASIYFYRSDVTGRMDAINFADFGLNVEHSDAKELGVALTRDDRWNGISDIRFDEMRDTEIAVLNKALEPLESTIRAAAAALRKDEEPK